MTRNESLRHAYLNDSLRDANNLIGKLGFELQNSSIPTSVRDYMLSMVAQYNTTTISREILLSKQLKECKE